MLLYLKSNLTGLLVFFYIVFQYSAPHLPGWPFPHNYSFFKLARVPTLFPEKKITMYTNKQQVPTGALIILITQNLAGVELRQAETDVAGLKKNKKTSHDPRRAWDQRRAGVNRAIMLMEMLQDATLALNTYHQREDMRLSGCPV